MNLFTVLLQDMEHQWQSEQVKSFIGRDPSGSFGLQARHEPLVACLVPGLARLQLQEGKRLYLAQPGSVVLFRDNVLRLATSQFILSEDRDQLITRMERAWQAAEQELRSVRTSYAQTEQALTRKLWEMSRQGGDYV